MLANNTGRREPSCYGVSSKDNKSVRHVMAKTKTIKAPSYWPLWGELTGYRWIPRTKGQ